MNDRRLIEETIPLEDISQESARKKSIRQGHISTLHIWWARRPLVASRAAVFGSLVIPAKISKDTLKKTAEITKKWLPTLKKTNITDEELKGKELYHFMRVLCTWEASNNKEIIDHARLLIRKSHDGEIPKVLDPFAGGGSIPLEALRLGCETYANELNPVAHIIELCTLVYPQKYGKEIEVEVDDEENNGQLNLVTGSSKRTKKTNKLAEDVKKWGDWVLEEAKKEVGNFYSDDKDGAIPVVYFWFRTIKCSNPKCAKTFPLIRNYLIEEQSNLRISLNTIFQKNEQIDFEIVHNPKQSKEELIGNIKKSSAVCLYCGQTVDANTIRNLGKEGKIGSMPLAVMYEKNGQKIYKKVDKKINNVLDSINLFLKNKEKLTTLKFLHEPIPLMSGTFNVPIYGIDRWDKLFNSRQLLTLLTFSEKIQSLQDVLKKSYKDMEYSKAIITYLACAFDSMLHYNTTISVWYWGHMLSAFIQGQALPMKWDYGEINPFGTRVGSWNYAINNIKESLLNLSSGLGSAKVTLGDAKRIQCENLSFNTVVTDPPYYNSVPYSDLSDFFYVWLKSNVGALYPTIFRMPTTPKNEEIVEMKSWDKKRYAHKDNKFYEDQMVKAFSEINRITKEDGIVALMFAHKSTSAWEALLNGIVDSGLFVSSSWPINMESATRMRAHQSAALANTILLICQKRKHTTIGFYDEVKAILEESIKLKLNKFWEQGIRGADFFISAIGPAIEVFGKYSKVKKLSGEEVGVSEFLKLVREEVTNYALQKILTRDIRDIDAETRFYILWRWAYDSLKVPFDDARILAQAIGAEVDDLMSKTGVLKKSGENVELLGPLDVKVTKAESIIDALHRSCQLWASGKKQELAQFLEENGKIEDENFWSTAQALSEVLPDGDKEKQLLQGLLASKSGIAEAIKQTKLF